jgi:UDP-N-acetylglucosamine/UDP-N-acetylgalactosamine diphosphorylase
MMQNGYTVSLSPDGNGGIFNALDTSGALSLLESTYHTNSVHVFSVDNVMCKVADPVFFGYALSRNADVGNKVVWKKDSSEKVGVVARKGGKLAVVEYSELSEDMANAQVEGKFVFGAGNICNHYFTVPFLKQVVASYRTDCRVMPYHVAKKKIPVADPITGETTAPIEINGIKLEAFIFDCFSLSTQSAILEVKREHEFGPVKNAPGSATDSPDTARRMLMDMHLDWAKRAGATFEFSEGCDITTAEFEISPLFSYDGEELDSVMKKSFKFTPSTQYTFYHKYD